MNHHEISPPSQDYGLFTGCSGNSHEVGITGLESPSPSWEGARVSVEGGDGSADRSF